MDSSSIVIIGGADGPTSIFVSSPGLNVLLIAIAAFALGLLAGYFYRRWKNNR